MNYQALSSRYSVAPQIQPDDVADIKADGFQVVICNRPDGEADDQPHAETIRQACIEAGVEFHHCPMQGPQVAPGDVDTLRGLLDGERKIFAYCRTGNRSAMFYQQANE